MTEPCLSFTTNLNKNSTKQEFAAWVNVNYPVVTVALYKNGCVEVFRKANSKGTKKPVARKRITKMTDKSLRRLMFAANRHTCNFGSMLTLTYPRVFPDNGKIVKEDLKAILQKLRRWGFRYLWFLEFQKRGAPHIHILIETNYISPRMRAAFAIAWVARIAKSAWFTLSVNDEDHPKELIKILKVNLHPKAWELIRNENGARNYVMKYASKMSQKKVPEAYDDVGRFWGISNSAMPDAEDYIEITESILRKWLKLAGHPAGEWDLIPRFLWGTQGGEDGISQPGN